MRSTFPFLSRPPGSIDRVDAFGIEGWVHVGEGEQAFLLVDGARVAIRPEIERPDVVAVGAAPSLATGFRIRFAELDVDAGRALSRLLEGRRSRIELFAGKRRITRRSVRLHPNFDLELVHLGEGRVEVWAAAPDWPPPSEAEILIDGQLIETHALTRLDLPRARRDGRKWGSAFVVRPACTVSARPARLSARMRGAIGEPEPILHLDLPGHVDRGAEIACAHTALRARRGEPIAIVLTVHNAAPQLERCLRALAEHTTRPAELIVVDDASDDPRIAAVLKDWEQHGRARVIRNRENLGYTRSVGLGLEEAGRSDVVLLNSDTRVGPRWLENLELAGMAAPDIGSVTAISDNAGAYSMPGPGPNPRPEGLTDAQWARLAARASGLVWPETPTGSGFCLFIKRACLDEVGSFDAETFPRGYGEENDWCLRAETFGWRHVVDERTLVLHERSASFGAEKEKLMAAGQTVVRERYPEYAQRVRTFMRGSAMNLARARLAAAVERLDPARPPLPRALFVVSAPEGGTPMTNADLMAGLEGRWDCWLLTCDARTMTLSRVSGRDRETVESHVLSAPIDPVSHRSAEYDAVIAHWLVAHAIELVHIRHIAWHGLGLCGTARDLGVPVVFSFHDYYPACPTVKLLDAEDRHCAGRCTPETGRDCAPDLWTGVETPALKHAWVHAWRARFARMLEACDGFVTTSPRARDLMRACFPILDGKPFAVIAHGRDLPSATCVAASPPDPGGKLRVLVPGTITRAKGAAVIAQALEGGAGDFAEFHVLGEVPDLEARPGLVIHGRYERDAFHARAARIAPHVGAVLSIWPETWCHTLTELWSAGLPAIGLDWGAVGDRIGAEGPGWLIDPAGGASAAELVGLLSRLSADPAELAAMTSKARGWTNPHTARAMAEDYARFYETLLAERRAFNPVSPAA